MINLRYHIVSITAVFLALAIGVVMGTSFLSRATVDLLNDEDTRQVTPALRERALDKAIVSGHNVLYELMRIGIKT